MGFKGLGLKKKKEKKEEVEEEEDRGDKNKKTLEKLIEIALWYTYLHL